MGAVKRNFKSGRINFTWFCLSVFCLMEVSRGLTMCQNWAQSWEAVFYLKCGTPTECGKAIQFIWMFTFPM
jgi:hypothetical protein